MHFLGFVWRPAARSFLSGLQCRISKLDSQALYRQAFGILHAGLRKKRVTGMIFVWRVIEMQKAGSHPKGRTAG
jgi:hypothetical protein